MYLGDYKMKRFLAIFLSVLCLINLSSCGEKNYSDKTVYFTTSDIVGTFDPTLANTPVEISIATNCFEGLMTRHKSGKIVLGAAESYDVDESGMVYTFKLREGAVWSDGETELVADDFVFGFQRALYQKTKAPYAPLLFSIKNAKKVNSGALDMSALGVEATGKYSLKITLANTDDGFLDALTKPVSSPCNRAFFEGTSGRYGLKPKYIISNGAFCINYLNSDSKTTIISNNEDYTGEFPATPKSVQISFGKTEDEVYTALEDAQADLGNIDCARAKSLEEKEYLSQLFYNTNYCLYMADDLSRVGADYKKALALDIDYGNVSANLTDYYDVPSGILPSLMYLSGKDYRKQTGEISYISYDLDKAKATLSDYTKASEDLNDRVLYYPSGEDKLKLVSNIIVQGWQKDLNVYIDSGEKTQAEIEKGIASGEIKIAIIKVKSEANDALDCYNYLADLGITSRVVSADASTLFAKEQSLVSSGKIYPLAAIPTAVSVSADIKDVVFLTGGKVIDFRFTKKD